MRADSYHLADGSPAGPDDRFAFVVTRFMRPREHYRYRLQYATTWSVGRHGTRELAIEAAVALRALIYSGLDPRRR